MKNLLRSRQPLFMLRRKLCSIRSENGNAYGWRTVRRRSLHYINKKNLKRGVYKRKNIGYSSKLYY